MGFPRNPNLRPVRSLPQRLMFALACVLNNVMALAVIAIALRRAPEGYEDETGFHFTRSSHPGGGASGLLPLILGTLGSIPELLR